MHPADPDRTCLGNGHPPNEILRIAGEANADLLVLGTHGLTGADRMLIGSTTLSVLRRTSMTTVGIPENGDLVIRRDGPNATPSYVISAIPGPDEVACATLAEAVSMGRSYAEHTRVNLWLARVGNEFTLRVRDPRPTAC